MKSLDPITLPSKQRGDIIRGAVPKPNPNHLGRMPKQEASMMKVSILRRYGKAILGRIFPHDGIRSRLQTDITDMRGAGVEGREACHQCR